jgi:hypothetical protein
MASMQKAHLRLIDAADQLARPELEQLPQPHLIPRDVDESARSVPKRLALALMTASATVILLLIAAAWLLAQRML